MKEIELTSVREIKERTLSYVGKSSYILYRMRIITRGQDVRVSMSKQKVNVQSTVIAK